MPSCAGLALWHVAWHIARSFHLVKYPPRFACDVLGRLTRRIGVVVEERRRGHSLALGGCVEQKLKHLLALLSRLRIRGAMCIRYMAGAFPLRKGDDVGVIEIRPLDEHGVMHLLAHGCRLRSASAIRRRKSRTCFS